LSTFIEASNVRVAASGGVKNDHVHPGNIDGGLKLASSLSQAQVPLPFGYGAHFGLGLFQAVSTEDTQ